MSTGWFGPRAAKGVSQSQPDPSGGWPVLFATVRAGAWSVRAQSQAMRRLNRGRLPDLGRDGSLPPPYSASVRSTQVLVLYRERRWNAAPAGGLDSGALSIQRLEGSRLGWRRTLWVFNRRCGLGIGRRAGCLAGDGAAAMMGEGFGRGRGTVNGGWGGGKRRLGVCAGVAGAKVPEQTKLSTC
jgi:hypothetical protein